MNKKIIIAAAVLCSALVIFALWGIITGIYGVINYEKEHITAPTRAVLYLEKDNYTLYYAKKTLKEGRVIRQPDDIPDNIVFEVIGPENEKIKISAASINYTSGNNEYAAVWKFKTNRSGNYVLNIFYTDGSDDEKNIFMLAKGSFALGILKIVLAVSALISATAIFMVALIVYIIRLSQTKKSVTPRAIENSGNIEINGNENASAVILKKDDIPWGVGCHVSSFASFIIPFGNIFGPLIIWLMKRKDTPFIDYHGKEALNFQLSMTIYAVVSSLLIFVFIGIVLVFAVIIIDIIFVIIAAVKTSEGEYYKYPLSIRFIK